MTRKRPGKVTITKDNVNALLSNMRAMAERQVLVGVPEDKSKRKADDGINNAALAYIHNNGSPVNNIPARPFMEPGIEKAQPGVITLLRKGAERGLENPNGVDSALERAGLLAVSKIRGVITSQEGFEPLSEETLAARKRKGFDGEKALIRTGQLRNSITYVVRKK